MKKKILIWLGIFAVAATMYKEDMAHKNEVAYQNIRYYTVLGSNSQTDVYVKYKDRNSKVKEIQQKLNALKYNLATDGIYGAKTKSAVNDFQRKNKIKVSDYVSTEMVSLMDIAIKKLGSAKTAEASESKEICAKLYEYMSKEKNGEAITARTEKLHDGNLHNACVLFASEALRGIGVDIPTSTWNTDLLVAQLDKQGFKKNYNLEELKPGAICFTTDADGGDGHSTHSFIFLGWASEGVAKIVDNQLYDYGSIYHNRSIEQHFLNGDKKKPKEATLFFMYK